MARNLAQLLSLWLTIIASPLLAKEWQLTVSWQKPGRPISPLIYGFGTYMFENRSQEAVWELRPTSYRWGGNTSSRFNYQIDAWNAGADWFFHNFRSSQKDMIGRFMEEVKAKGAAPVITIPLLPWIAKDGESKSFPRALFPDQERFERDAGNGKTKDGKLLTSKPQLTSIANSPALQANWVKKLKTEFRPYPHYYIMDNEPMLWNSTHRDVITEPLRYQSYFDLYLSYALAIRKADPQAVIVGPAAWGWMEMNYSAWDIEGPHSQGKKQTDRKANGDKPLLEWFLEKIVKKEQELKVSLLDELDIHFYPETDRWPSGGDDNPQRRQALLNSTRSLWDREYRDQSWINEKIYFIPRLQDLAKKYKPSLKISIGEYNFRSEYDPAGAIAQAEILGTFAKTGLDRAHYWDFPKKEGTHRAAFLLFRNYDGKNASFGPEWIDNSLGQTEDLSVFSAKDSRQKILTLAIVSKSLKESSQLILPWSSLPKVTSAQLFSYHAGDGTRLSRQKKLELKKDLKLDLPPLSMHMLELRYQ